MIFYTVFLYTEDETKPCLQEINKNNSLQPGDAKIHSLHIAQDQIVLFKSCWLQFFLISTGLTCFISVKIKYVIHTTGHFSDKGDPPAQTVSSV